MFFVIHFEFSDHCIKVPLPLMINGMDEALEFVRGNDNDISYRHPAKVKNNPRAKTATLYAVISQLELTITPEPVVNLGWPDKLTLKVTAPDQTTTIKGIPVVLSQSLCQKLLKLYGPNWPTKIKEVRTKDCPPPTSPWIGCGGHIESQTEHFTSDSGLGDLRIVLHNSEQPQWTPPASLKDGIYWCDIDGIFQTQKEGLGLPIVASIPCFAAFAFDWTPPAKGLWEVKNGVASFLGEY